MRGGHVSHQAPFLLSTCPHSSSPLSQKKAWAWAQCTWDRQPGARAVGWAQLHRPAHPHRPDLQTVGLPRPFSAEIAWKMSSCGVCNVNSGDATGIQAPQGCARLQGFLRPEKTLGFSFPIRGGNGWQWPKAGSGPRWRVPSGDTSSGRAGSPKSREWVLESRGQTSSRKGHIVTTEGFAD